MSSAFLYLVFVGLFQFEGIRANNLGQDDDRIQLHLLNLLPFPDNRPDSGWDKAFELIPAAQLAIEHIKNSDFLPGYKLNLHTVESEACGISTINDGLVNTYSKLFDPNRSLNVVGLTGLFCSSVTDVIAPIVSFTNLTFLQVAASTTSLHRNITRFPWLIHLISSSNIFNRAMFGMMKEFNWQKVAIVHDALGIFFRENAVEFVDGFNESSEYTITASIPITSSNVDVFPILVGARARIIYISVTVQEATKFICEAYERSSLYPGYVYVFHERTIEEFKSSAYITDCTTTQILEALEGVFLLEFDLITNTGTKLVSNYTYEEYYQAYEEKLEKIESERNIKGLDRNNVYANSMYDEVWAFALALKASLDNISTQNMDLESLSFQESRLLADILKSNILNVSFEGASGSVEFDDKGEVRQDVNIYQVVNGSRKLVGRYNHVSEKVENVSLLNIPSDTFEIKVTLIPHWLKVIFTVASILCVIFTSVILFLVLLLRNRPEVKATSPFVNLIIFAGCYFTFVGAEMRTVSRGYSINDSIAFTLICNLEVWFGYTGFNLIFSTLLIRLLRISHVFRAHRKTSAYWKNHYLILWIFSICFGGIIINVIWTLFDKVQIYTTVEYRPDGRPPYFESKSVCSCNNLELWLLVALFYSGTIIAIVVFLAVQTRKIRRSNFKDTKKINTFIFATTITIAVFLPLKFITDNIVYEHICTTLTLLLIGLNCQLFIFVPQVHVTLCNMIIEKKKGLNIPLTKKETQFVSSVV